MKSMKKKIIAVILTIVMTVVLLPMGLMLKAEAADHTHNGVRIRGGAGVS